MRVFVTDSRIHRLMVVTCRVTALRNRNASAMPDAFRNHDAHDYAERIRERLQERVSRKGSGDDS
jgi:hypothetical protein